MAILEFAWTGTPEPLGVIYPIALSTFAHYHSYHAHSLFFGSVG